ncbi:MAG: tRNA preQ1(34) S-adenosylmethionine ribosyltransferase-isomerase QueA [Pseudomonadota bacterium]
MSRQYSTDDFDYPLPTELIASKPVEQRDQSRLLVLDKDSETLEDRVFTNIVEYLSEGDLLVLNDTRVFPARLFANKESGGKIEILAERILSTHQIKAQLKSNRTPKIGAEIIINENVRAVITDRQEEFFILSFQNHLSALEVFERFGHVPLPPYIDRDDQAEDVERYQTVFADKKGAVAAPTAGLHFTKELLETLQSKGIQIAKITLHVGAGTFKPIKVDDPSQHIMHSEYGEVSQEVCDQISKAKVDGKQVTAVGTTCVRALESAAYNDGLKPLKGDTDIFITPGFEFKVVDNLITNFHLPKSTLMMLVSALAGHENIMQAYHHAIQNKYRFYSYGDAMFIRS